MKPPEEKLTGPIVIKVGGTTLEDPATSPQLWDGIADLARTSDNGVIVVHGGGKAVDRLLDKLGMAVERRQGLRVTPPDQMEYITGVLAGTLNKSIVAQLIRRGAKAVGLCIGDSGLIPCVRKQIPEVDLGLVGEVQIVPGFRSGGVVEFLVGWRYTPVVCSIGIDTHGTLLNLNADDAAAGLAYHVRASTLVLMTDVPGILDQERQLIPQVSNADIERLIERQIITGGMIPKARAAATAAAQMEAPVVILSGNDPRVLARWASGQTAGTTVLPPPLDEEPTR